MVRLPGYAERKPGELSGGQRQRVALARAIVNRPKVLLLDEPLGALDLKLREQMQVELKTIQSEVGITFVYVTHDQDEALTMSDRIAVFNEGRIEQVSPPEELYEHPRNEFVAGFVGVSNVIERDGERLTIRPEKIELLEPGAGADGLHSERGRVTEVAYAGMVTRYTVALDAGGELQLVRQNLEGASARRRPSRAKRSWWGGARSTRPPSRGKQPTRRMHHEEKGRQLRPHGVARRRRSGRVHARPRRLRLQQRQHQRRQRRAAEARQGRGRTQPDLLGRLRRTDEWTKPFEQETGCKVNDKVAGTSDEMVELMRTGQYDGVSASGNATARLVAATTSTRSTSASSPTTRRSSPTSRTSPTTPSTASTTGSRTAAAPTY